MYLCTISLTQGTEYRHQISKSFTIIVNLKIRSYIGSIKIDNVLMPVAYVVYFIHLIINVLIKFIISTFFLSNNTLKEWKHSESLLQIEKKKLKHGKQTLIRC